jgi:hypothetical protein
VPERQVQPFQRHLAGLRVHRRILRVFGSKRGKLVALVHKRHGYPLLPPHGDTLLKGRVVQPLVKPQHLSEPYGLLRRRVHTICRFSIDRFHHDLCIRLRDTFLTKKLHDCGGCLIQSSIRISERKTSRSAIAVAFKVRLVFHSFCAITYGVEIKVE